MDLAAFLPQNGSRGVAVMPCSAPDTVTQLSGSACQIIPMSDCFCSALQFALSRSGTAFAGEVFAQE